MNDITEAELRTAFKRCQLWRVGWTFERAIKADSIVLRGLRNQVIASRKYFEKQNGKPAPVQQALI